ncbi:MAG TPA: OmpA family protein [Bacteroidia bacterium]|nr:OmpA family protein [Bacteroidia bacterium]
MRKSLIIAVAFGAALYLSSCVPQNKLIDEQNKRKTAEAAAAAAKAADQDCETKKTELQSKLDMLQRGVAGLTQDTSIVGTSYRDLTSKYDKLNQINEELLSKYNQMLQGSQDNATKLSGQLQVTETQLLQKQDQLNALQAQLDKEKAHLDSLNIQLQQREAKVNELQSILKRKDAAVDSLKQKIQNALIGYANNGITVYEKNGKVYVSLDEKLLFASGKTEVQAGGVTALQKLSQALEANPDININVEGHTDDVAMHGSGEIKDNWDLSVMRATSVVKILLQDKNIDAHRITASGVSEYDPVDNGDNAEARKKNRRTDIILTPKLNELFKILNAQ